MIIVWRSALVPGAVVLAEFLAESRFLQTLDVRKNLVLTGGLMAFALALKLNRTLVHLDLDRNPREEKVNPKKKLLVHRISRGHKIINWSLQLIHKLRRYRSYELSNIIFNTVISSVLVDLLEKSLSTFTWTLTQANSSDSSTSLWVISWHVILSIIPMTKASSEDNIWLAWLASSCTWQLGKLHGWTRYMTEPVIGP